NRYLLRFETSNRKLYEVIHPRSGRKRPDGTPVESDRFVILRTLRRLGYEVGSGVMIGIPGQSYDDLAGDIEWFRKLGLDMIGVGPFLASPGTPLGDLRSQKSGAPELHCDDQVPATAEMTCRVISLSRILCPEANIPATTALATLDADAGRNHGLLAGANVIMPNLTPEKYRELYSIYPGKAGAHETAEVVNDGIREQIAGIGRTVGHGPGDSPAFRKRSGNV
ncbi:MAG: [FeFe] hydrogenase H-cluster radical SAM maturase HydE, partial [Planctomycetia bacterium]|nr:[FeFe] hydrogenase H-cluster radical SAM maturase HydE [Planctomycetia bacterium]